MSNFLEEDDSPWSQHPSVSGTLSGASNAFDAHMSSPWGNPEEEPEENTNDAFIDNPFAARSDSIDDPLGVATQQESDPLAMLSAAPEGPSKQLHFVHQESSPYGDNASSQADEDSGSKARKRRVKSKVTHKKAVFIDPLAGQGSESTVSVDPLGASTLGAPKKPAAADLDDVPLAVPSDLDEVRLAMSQVHVDAGQLDVEATGLASSTPAPGSGTTRTGSFSSSGTAPATALTDPYEFETPQATFTINVGDPSRIGDLTSSHTEYTVQTTTDYAKYPKDSAVQRRYRDFRWLYRALQHNHPAVIVPPPPDKQAVGRFNDEFIENRRLALEVMLHRIVRHPQLYMDADLEAFLTHADFTEYLKTRVLTEDEMEATSSSGFISSLLGRIEEPDVWLQEQRARLDRSEHELRTTFRIYESVLGQRKDLSDALDEFANVTSALAVVEPTKRLGTVLQEFADVHQKISANVSRHRQQEMLSLGNQLEEQLRQVGSVRDALDSRQRVQAQVQTAQSDFDKKKQALDRILRQGRSQADRHDFLKSEVDEAKEKLDELKEQANYLATLIVKEMQHLDYQNFSELRSSVELLVESGIETQKEIIETWETFYSRCFASNPV